MRRVWGSRGGYQVILVGILAGALTLSAAGCGSGEGESPVATGPSITPSIPSAVAPPSETPSLDAPTTDAPIPDDSAEPSESSSPAVLPADVAGRPLTLSNIFKYPDGWKDGRYDVADRKQATGIGGTIPYCGEGYQQVLELRLANNFSRFKLAFGQSNSSESSDQSMQVRIDANGQYQDQKSAKLNQVTSFDLPVSKVNALKVTVSMKDTDACAQGGSIEAVLMNMVLS